MPFYKSEYLFIFLPIALLLYFFSKKIHLNHKYILIFLSCFFYSFWNINFLPLILFSVIINFFIASKIIKKTLHKKILLILGIIFNLTLLIIFKYLNFIVETLNFFLEYKINYIEIPFPLAISFFTFQTIAFLVNCYDDEIVDIKFKDYFLFIVYFPQLIAGPIVLYKKMIPQFNDENNLNFNRKNFNLGLIILVIGLTKKIIFADTLGLFVDQTHNNLENLNFGYSWLLSLSFTFQFYFDFSGYVDMAIGSALMFNIRLPQNFNSPLKSTSIINFWQRWHITLTSFLTNYLYTPWVKSLKEITFIKSMLILFIVFILAGFWHGPSWNFIFFGMFHGIGLIINHIYRQFISIKLPKILSWFLTFHYVNLSFVLFRTSNINDVINIFYNMFGITYILDNKSLDLIDPNKLENFLNIKYLIIFSLSFILCFFLQNTNFLINRAEIEKNKNE